MMTGRDHHSKTMKWIEFDNGASIGERGSENGIILQDDEHSLGARITLEQDGSIAPFSITCGIYGWMFHTRFFRSQQTAQAEYEQMKAGLSDILRLMPIEPEPESHEQQVRISEAISKFADRYP